MWLSRRVLTRSSCCLPALALGLLSQALMAQALSPSLSASSQGKIASELLEAMASADVSAVYRVYAVLGDELRGADFRGQVENLGRGQRQAFVASRLKAHAQSRQAGVLAALEGLRNSGAVQRVRPLWINNTVVFHGSAEAILDVAARPDVRSISWDPQREPSEYQDDLGTSDGGGFSTYFSDDFETGSLSGVWSTSSTGCGDASVTNLYGPSSGSFHVVIASTIDNCASTAVLNLSVDLSGVTTASLRYRFKDIFDEFNAGADILEASDDGGANWVKVADLTGQDGLYITRTHDLDPLGLSYGANFMLRWRWADNFAPETDGISLDDVQLADGFAPPPVPGPQPNLVGLQAPDLWALGFNGQGVSILNIDDGVDTTHPDLANRVWANPNDPVDGVDNDNNGFIDDFMGWDFIDDDNDPSTALTHGTNTSGIMVGDGASGIFQTGMAPGAKMAVARIGGSTDHWAAQQWGISVGIDCSSSSHSYKWYFNPQPDYHMHRVVEEMVLAAGIIHANSIGNDGSSPAAPIPFNISAPGLVPAPWLHPVQLQQGVSAGGVMSCGGIIVDESHYVPSGSGPVAWEDITIYAPDYPHAQDPAFFDFPVGGFGGSGQGLIKPDVVTFTNVVTTTNGVGYNSSFGGTSASTPHLGGSLALLLSAQPLAAPRHVAQALQRSAKDLGAPGKDNLFGAGKVQVRDAALRLLGIVKASELNPTRGSQVSFTTYGSVGEFFVTLWSLNLGAAPFAGGVLDLGAPFFILQAGKLRPLGNEVTVMVPHSPALIDVSVHFQSVQDDTGGLTGQVLFSTVESVVIRD